MSDRREDLARALFGLEPGADAAQRHAATTIAVAIADDLCARSKVLTKRHGPGILAIRPEEEDENSTTWLDGAAIEDMIKTAEARGDTTMSRVFASIARELALLIPSEKTLILIDDSSSMRFIALMNDDPAGQIQRIINAATA